MRTRSLLAASLSGALLLGTSAAVGAQDDPAQLLAQSLTATSAATSFHFLATVDGVVNLGDSFGGAPLTLTGTQAEGDVSVAPLAVQLTFDVPLGYVELQGAVVYPNDGNLYVQLAEPGASAAPLWHKVPTGDLPMNLGASPAPGAPDMATKIDDAITKSGATLTNQGDVACASGTCTQLHLEVPAAALDSTFGSMLPMGSLLPTESPAPSSAAVAPIPVDILVDDATKFIDSVSAHVVDASSDADLTITIALSAYNQPVTITAPPADQVSDKPLF